MSDARKLENIEEHLAAASRVVDILDRDVRDLKRRMDNLEAGVKQYTPGANCTNCGAKYRGPNKKPRNCTVCGKQF